MKNESFVANRVDIDTAWVFKTVSDAEPSANIEEAVSLVNDLLASFDGFVCPTNTEYVLWIPEPDSDGDVPVTGKIESPNGLTAAEITTELREYTDGGTGTFRRLTINGNRTRIDLKDGEHLIDATSDRYRQWTGEEVIDQSPVEDVFRIDVFYNDSSDDRCNYYQIAVWTYTDIWFEDTELGERNRERLAVALDRLVDALDVICVDFESRVISEHSLKQGEFSNLFPDRKSE
ncbi:hypothetical protein [Halorussus amylolyticus]|uniref:hypothetical protein n=1 Tax=Halorussus amylolyticus TaxID=1126242 RepID=UPI00104A2643|nr:hypothetical protein [Halorussus amylolyticus]